MFDGSSLEALEIQYLSIDVGIILFILRLRSNLLSGLALSLLSRAGGEKWGWLSRPENDNNENNNINI